MTKDKILPNSPEPIDVGIANRLIKMQLTDLRKAHHLTQKELAKVSGLSEGCISNIESDNDDKDTSPTLRSVLKYASSLGADLYIKAKSDDN